MNNTKTIGDLVKIYKGNKANEVFADKRPNAVRYLQIDDLRPNAKKKFTYETDSFLANEKDVLIAWDGANAGTVSFGLNGYIGSTLAALRIKSVDYDTAFIGRFLQSKSTFLRENCTGATIPHINRNTLENLSVQIPRPDEQKRIAAILDKADRLRRQRRFSQTLSDSFLQSIFIKLFGDPVSNPKHWDSCSVNELCSVIVDCPHSTPKYTGKVTHFACIRTSDIQDGLVDWASTKYVNEDEYNTRIARYKPVVGDVLYTREGERYGLAAQVPKHTTLCLGQRMMLLKADSKLSNNEFLCALMNSPLIYRQAENLVSGSTSPHVNVGDIREFSAIKPPLPLQEKFAEIVQKFERVRRQQREATRQAEHLFQTLLHRAFRGEL